MSDKEPWDAWNEMSDAARMLDWFNLRSRLAAVEAENDEMAAKWNDVVNSKYEALARLAAADALLREARPVTIALMEIVRDASRYLPKGAPVDMKAANAATDALVKWAGAIDAHLAAAREGEK
jgi:hypothetical protein